MEINRVRDRLAQLQEMSQDPEYDRYLAQMVRDLDTGKATPEQVEREARRSYEIYKERMHIPKKEAEFKVGIHVFGVLGAVFVLIALIIFGFNYLNSLWQGICLYGAALVLIALSETALRRRMPVFAHVITGIGIGGIYVADMVNYLVLHNLNEIGLTVVLMVFGLGIVFFLRKQMPAGIVYLAANFLFTVVIAGLAWEGGVESLYLVLFVIAAFICTNVMGYLHCMGWTSGDGKREAPLFPFICIENGLFLFLLFLIGNAGRELEVPAKALFVHLIAEVLLVFVCALLFLIWDKEDRRRWAQVYYGAGAVLLLCSFSEYHLEIMIGQLLVLLSAKLVNKKKEMAALEGIVVAWVGFSGLWLSDYWYCWIFAGALVLGGFWIRYFQIYQELIIMVSVLLIWWSQCRFYLDGFGFPFKWFYPVSVGILFLFFLFFNRKPGGGILKRFSRQKNDKEPFLKIPKADQMSYNIITVTVMGLFYLMALFAHDLALGLTMMALFAVTVVVMFGKRYRMYIPRRYLLLAGGWSFYALISCVDSPVLASILLMVSALGCVGIGFKQSDKAARISGLVVAIFVCIKLVFYDFARVQTIHKMIVFLVVGILALVISFLYILLEKNAEKKKALQTERKPEE